MNKQRMTVTTFLSRLLLGCCLVVGASGMVVAADVDSEINDIDIKINEIEATIDRNRAEVKAISVFTDLAQDWFARLNTVERQIRAKEKEKEGQHYESGQQRVEKQLVQLRAQRDAIKRLNDEFLQGYSGLPLSTIDDLRKEFNSATQIATDLQKETADKERKLQTLRDDRQELSTRSPTPQLVNEGDVRELKRLRKDYQFYADIVNNDKIWCVTNPLVQSLVAFPLYFNRTTFFDNITQAYLREIMANNQPYSSAELSSRIKEAKHGSDEAKRIIRETVLPDMLAQIKELEKKVGSIAKLVDPTGCWMLRLSEVSTLRVSGSDRNGYRGVVEINKLRYFSTGETVFIVERIDGSNNTFQGTEYAYSDHGDATRLTLRLAVTGNQMSYTTQDFNSTLTRCP